jgi:hypothetical protein
MNLCERSNWLHNPSSKLICLFCVLSISSFTTQAKSSSSTAPVEFRGYFKTADSLSFSLRIPQREQSFWIEMGQWKNGIEIVEFDQENYSLTVQVNGEVFELPMIQASNRPLSVITSDLSKGVAGASDEMRRPPRPVRLADIHTPQSFAERMERTQQIRAERGLPPAGSSTIASDTSSSTNEVSQSDTLTASQAVGNAAPDTLELQRGNERILLTGGARGAYRGHYVVRTPRQISPE